MIPAQLGAWATWATHDGLHWAASFNWDQLRGIACPGVFHTNGSCSVGVARDIFVQQKNQQKLNHFRQIRYYEKKDGKRNTPLCPQFVCRKCPVLSKMCLTALPLPFKPATGPAMNGQCGNCSFKI